MFWRVIEVNGSYCFIFEDLVRELFENFVYNFLNIYYLYIVVCWLVCYWDVVCLSLGGKVLS